MGGPLPGRPRAGPGGPPVKYHYSHRFFTDPVRRGGEPREGSRFWRQAPAALSARAGRGVARARPAPGTVPGGEFDWGGTPVKR